MKTEHKEAGRGRLIRVRAIRLRAFLGATTFLHHDTARQVRRRVCARLADLRRHRHASLYVVSPLRVIFDRSSQSCVPVHVRFALKADLWRDRQKPR